MDLIGLALARLHFPESLVNVFSLLGLDHLLCVHATQPRLSLLPYTGWFDVRARLYPYKCSYHCAGWSPIS